MSDVAATSAATTPPQHPISAWKSASGFGFRDILDIINPLQHLPIIGSVYRWLTGDQPGEAAQLAGDALYGGPIGLGVSVVSAAFQDDQGHDLGERALIAMFGSHGAAGTTTVASASPPQTTPLASSPGKASPAPERTGSSQPATASPAVTGAIPVALASQNHQPIPLFGGIAQPVPGAPLVSPDQSPARAFEAHQAMLERSIMAGRTGPAPTKPVPLVLPAGTFINRPPIAMAAPAARQNPAQAQAAQPAAVPTVDVPQKMLDGLDKYMQLQREREGSSAAPTAGSTVDLAL